MTRRRTILVVLLAVLIIAVVVIAAVLHTDFGRFRPAIESALSERLGREVSIESSLSIRVGRTLRVRADGVRVANADWGSAPDLLVIDHFELALPTASLFRRPVEVSSLKASGIRMEIEYDDDGTSNLPGAAETQTERQENDEPSAFPALFRHAELGDATVTWHLEGRQTPLVFQLQTFTHHLQPSGVVKASARGSLDGDDLAWEGAIDNYDALLDGHDVHFDGQGRFGGVSFTGTARVDSIARPVHPAFQLKIEGDEFGDVARLVGRDAPAGAFSIMAESRPGPDGVTLTFNGDVGEVDIGVVANLSEFTRLDNGTLEVNAKGPELGRVTRFLGLGDWPMVPFRLQGHMVRQGRTLEIDQASLEAGDANFSLTAYLPALPTLENGKGNLHMEGPDLARFSRLFGGQGRVQGAYQARMTLEKAADGTGRLHGAAVTSLGELHLDGAVGAGTGLAGSTFTVVASGDNAGDVLLLFDVSGYEGRAYHLAGDVAVSEQAVTIAPGATLTVGDNQARIGGTVPTTGEATGIALDVSVSGKAIEEHLGLLGGAFRNSPGGGDAVRGPFRANGHLEYGADVLSLKGVELVVGTLSARADIELNRPLSSADGHFDVRVDTGSAAAAMPAGLPFQPGAEAAQLALRGTAEEGLWRLETARLRIGDASAQAVGVIGPWPGLAGTDITLSLDVADLSRVGRWRAKPLPAIPLRGGARLHGNLDVFSIDQMALASGHSDLAGEATIGLGGATPRLEWATRSDMLDLSPFAEDQADGKTAGSGSPARKPGLPFDDVPFPLDRLAGFEARFNMTADTLRLEDRDYTDVEFDGEVASGAMRVGRIHGKGLQGDLEGAFSLVPVGKGLAEVSIRSSATGLRLNLSRELVSDPAVLPEIEYGIQATGRGRGLYETLETLNGVATASVSGGTIPDSLLASFDGRLLEQVLNAVLPGRVTEPTTQVTCAAARLEAEDGVVRTAPGIALVTSKVRMISQGEIDLSDGRIDLSFESHPNRIYETNVSELLINPFVRFSGTLAEPKVSFDKPKALLNAGLAVGTSGLSILARGLWNRLGRASDPCDEYREFFENPEKAASGDG